jgi:hypothetical protein
MNADQLAAFLKAAKDVDVPLLQTGGVHATGLTIIPYPVKEHHDLATTKTIFTPLETILAARAYKVKASKVEFGVEEITFHKYRVIGGDGPQANTTSPKDETLDPIRSCTIPQTVTQLKAFLGSTQQMAQYVPYYALVAALLHKLTRKSEVFPSGSKWIPGSDYDLAYHHVRSLILDRPL